jgi:hypothetical protein
LLYCIDIDVMLITYYSVIYWVLCEKRKKWKNYMDHLMRTLVKDFFSRFITFFKEEEGVNTYFGDWYSCRPQKTNRSVQQPQCNLNAGYLVASSKAQPLYLCIPHAVCCLSYSFSCGYSETTASNSEGHWPTCSACLTSLSKLTAFTWNTGLLMTLTF